MNTGDLLLHPAVETQLEQFMAAPAHAVLLSGPHGIGKARLAQLMAARLLGLADETRLANAAYYQSVMPQNGGILIEQVRTLTQFFRLAVPGRHDIARVAVMQDADAMGTEAQNALLKLLEEPPAGSVLVLTSSRPGRLLPTIRSRTTSLHMPAPSAKAVQSHFEAAGYASDAVRSAVLRAGTDIAAAAELLEGGSAQSESLQLVRQVLGGTTYDRLLLVESLAKQKDAAKTFADDLANVSLASLEAAARKGTATDRWRQVVQAAASAQDALEQNGNVKLVLTELVLSL